MLIGIGLLLGLGCLLGSLGDSVLRFLNLILSSGDRLVVARGLCSRQCSIGLSLLGPGSSHGPGGLVLLLDSSLYVARCSPLSSLGLGDVLVRGSAASLDRGLSLA